MKVILPGSYDPVTLGHLDLIRRASEQFGEVFAVVFINPEKKYRFSAEERVKMLALATEGLDNVRVDFSDGLVIDYMHSHGIDKIVKGYRNETDILYEKKQAEYNLLHGGYETELWECRVGLENISSTAARQAISENRDLAELLPDKVVQFIKKH